MNKTNNEETKYVKVKVRRLNKKNLVLLIIMFIAIIALLVSTFNFIKWTIDNKKIDKQINNISKVVKVIEVKDNDNTEIIKQEKELDKSDPYWDYIKYNLIDINFKDLISINPDTKGWIKVNGTNINYPFVQRDNNDFYLNHDFNQKSNGGGWVFLDYRNNITNNEKNTIVYGHGRQNKTIFGTLKDILKDNWLNNTDNHVIRISTEYENTLWQVFSVYRIPTTNDYIQTKFISNEEYLNFLNLISSRSIHNFNVNINESDRIITLSTCYNDDDKVVLHAKLIKKEQKN